MYKNHNTHDREGYSSFESAPQQNCRNVPSEVSVLDGSAAAPTVAQGVLTIPGAILGQGDFYFPDPEQVRFSNIREVRRYAAQTAVAKVATYTFTAFAVGDSPNYDVVLRQKQCDVDVAIEYSRVYTEARTATQLAADFAAHINGLDNPFVSAVAAAGVVTVTSLQAGVPFDNVSVTSNIAYLETTANTAQFGQPEDVTYDLNAIGADTTVVDAAGTYNCIDLIFLVEADGGFKHAGVDQGIEIKTVSRWARIYFQDNAAGNADLAALVALLDGSGLSVAAVEAVQGVGVTTTFVQ